MSNSDLNGFSGWVTAGIATIIATLSSVVAWLFKLRENENSRHIESLTKQVETISVKADKCEEERGELRTKIEVLETKLSFIDVNGTKFSHKLGEQN